MQFYTFILFVLMISVSTAILDVAGVFPDYFDQPTDTVFTETIREQAEDANLAAGGQTEPGTVESFSAALGSFGSAITIFTTTLAQAVVVAPLLVRFMVPFEIAILLAIPVWLVYLMAAIQFIKPFKQFR